MTTTKARNLSVAVAVLTSLLVALIAFASR